MIRGTTPLHVFTLPFSTDLIKNLRVIYSQNDEPILKKELDDCKLNGNTVEVKLSQVDTFTFNSDYPVEIQVRVLTKTGDALASLPQRVGLDRCLENEVL